MRVFLLSLAALLLLLHSKISNEEVFLSNQAQIDDAIYHMDCVYLDRAFGRVRPDGDEIIARYSKFLSDHGVKYEYKLR